MTTMLTTATTTPRRSARLSAEVVALREKFPPRSTPSIWPETRHPREAVLARLLAPPFPLDSTTGQRQRRFGLIRILDWLSAQPGQTWQERWQASGLDTGEPAPAGQNWRREIAEWLKQTGRICVDNTSAHQTLGAGLLQLICADVIRPSMAWLLTNRAPHNLAAEMARVRDPAGFAVLNDLTDTSVTSFGVVRNALIRIAVIMAAKGGTVRDITVGDTLELMDIAVTRCGQPTSGARGPYFYQILHAMGLFPLEAPRTVQLFCTWYHGQLTLEQMIDRYDLACRPIRDVLVDYLRERRPSLDYATMPGLANQLGQLFWKDLEVHHPGIDSLDLAPDIAAAWKQRIRTKSTPASPDGASRAPRADVSGVLNTVRAFYLDLAHWAVEDPARWGPWAVRCPIRAEDIQTRKERGHRKSRMDQRTRERLPVLPTLVEGVDQTRKSAADLLRAAEKVAPGQTFTAAGQTLRRAVMTKTTKRIWGDPQTGARRDLTREEDNAFWAWAVVEILRHTGIRVEELVELSHHSLVQHRLPTTGETIPLLHIAPSKTDEERLLVISPELADVLAIILRRVRTPDGTVPLVIAYDSNERVWNPPMPLLLQHRVGLENHALVPAAVRRLLNCAMSNTGLTNASGQPLRFVPHDFRRIFTTEAIMNGMPPHITQMILGHRDINTTMGYKAIYPEETIQAHRGFIARRRQLRPSEEYRTPTDAEWEQFLGHFERRRVALGDCGRAYGTSCIHEHSCIRCPLLRIDPAQRPRLIEIRDNLATRIAEAEREHWTGEAEGLKTSLAATNAKIAQLDGILARRSVNLGTPTFPDAAARNLTIPDKPPRASQTVDHPPVQGSPSHHAPRSDPGTNACSS